ncbi:MAG: hypothetical protein ACLR0P_00740 [Oscillospiraceae bacterium]
MRKSNGKYELRAIPTDKDTDTFYGSVKHDTETGEKAKGHCD